MATTTSQENYSYPHPFFRLDNYFMPPSIKEMFKWIRAIFYGDAMVGSTISKIAEYPITRLIVEAEDVGVRQRWERILNKTLDIRSTLIQIGFDYFCFGNAFVTLYQPFNRFLKCRGCNKLKNVVNDDVKYKLKLGSKDGVYATHNCDKCGGAEHDIKDVPTRRLDRINLVRWNPENISIVYNSISGTHTYYYTPSNDLQRAVFSNQYDIINELPLIFIEAIRRRKAVRLSQANVFHFKRPTLAESGMGWGKPLILHSMKRVFYLNVLRKAQEQIAIEHIVPMDIIFPVASGPVNPYEHTSLAFVRTQIENSIETWRQDRLHKPVFPIPVGTARVGGDGRAMMLGPEIDAVVAEIAAGMGVPREFVFGGLSWTGSSVSLRILENHFLVYRETMDRFVGWTKDLIRRRYNIPDADVKFSDFKMADDIQRKQLIFQLNAANKISTRALHQEMGFDPDEMFKEIQDEMDKQGEIQRRMMVDQARSAGEAQLVQTRFQGKAQVISAEDQVKAQEAQKNALKVQNPSQYRALIAQEQAAELQAMMQLQQMQMGGMPPEQAQQGQEQPPQEQGQEQQYAEEEQPQEEEQGGSMYASQGQAFATPGGEQSLTIDPNQQAASWAARLEQMAPQDRMLYERHIMTNMPNMWQMMAPYLSDGAVDMRAMPEQGPPMRENSPI
jgi:hypothetical protein